MDISRLLASTEHVSTPQILDSVPSSSVAGFVWHDTSDTYSSLMSWEPEQSSSSSEASFDAISEGNHTDESVGFQFPECRSTADGFFPCRTCGRRYKTKQGWKSHQWTHIGNGQRPKPYACPHEGCGRRFTQIGNLKTHKNTHTGERPYECKHPGCTRAFGQGTNLRKHEANHRAHSR